MARIEIMNSYHHSKSRAGRLGLLARGALIGALSIASIAGTVGRAEARPASSVEFHPNLVYADAAPPGTGGNLLDLYVPDGPGHRPRPLVIWSEGCAWLCDNGKDGAAAIASIFTDKGYAVAGVSIRASFQAAFPGQLHDIRAAIRWLREHATEYNLDPNRFAIMGNSSGGWAAAIAGTTSDVAQLPGEPDVDGISSAVQAAVPFFPPTAFLEMNGWYVDHPEVFPFINHDAPLTPLPPPWFFPAASPESLLVGCTDTSGNLLGIQSCPTQTQAANPISYVHGAEVPMLIFHGDADPLVPHGQSELLYEALAQAGNEVTFVSVRGAGHSVSDPTLFMPIIGAQQFTVLHTNRRGRETVRQKPAPTWNDIERFIHVALRRAH
jgi:acetyl esterase/lipase